MEKTKHNFGEQEKENNIKVWQAPTFITSRNKAIEMIDSGKYGLCDSDFWILKNKTKNGGYIYTSLIISHNGCLKINSQLSEDKRFMSKYLSEPQPSPFGNGAVILAYDDGELREYGEVSADNCKSPYPMAVLLKRVMDRVILKKSELAYSGIYSEVESDEFAHDANEDNSNQDTKPDVECVTKKIDPNTGEVIDVVVTKETQSAKTEKKVTEPQINRIRSLYSDADIKRMLDKLQLSDIHDLTLSQASTLITYRTQS